MRAALALLSLALVVALTLPARPALAQFELVESDPPDGAMLAEPPLSIQLCFTEHLQDQFSFHLTIPDGRTPGVSVLFQEDSQCVIAAPLIPDDAEDGDYVLRWNVVSADSEEPLDGELEFSVGEPDPTPSPPRPGDTPEPEPTEEPDEAPPSNGGGNGGDSTDGRDILDKALITTAAIGGAAAFSTLAYLLRRRVGYDIHRPPEGGEDAAGSH